MNTTTFTHTLEPNTALKTTELTEIATHHSISFPVSADKKHTNPKPATEHLADTFNIWQQPKVTTK